MQFTDDEIVAILHALEDKLTELRRSTRYMGDYYNNPIPEKTKRLIESTKTAIDKIKGK